MEIAQDENSLEEITEIDPLGIAEIFGNIGGFWDLLLLLWPLFFVAAARQDPHLKVRNFRKSISRGSERVTGFAQPVRLSVSLKRRSELARRTVQQTTADTGDGRPTWENAEASARQQIPPREHDPRDPRVSEDASSIRSPYPSSASRAGVTRHVSLPEGSWPRSSPESPREPGGRNDMQVARDPPTQSPMAPPRSLRAAPTASRSSSQASAVFTV